MFRSFTQNLKILRKLVKYSAVYGKRALGFALHTQPDPVSTGFILVCLYALNSCWAGAIQASDTQENELNTIPNCVNDFASTRLDQAVRIDVLANDTDADGNKLFVISVTEGRLGSARLNTDGSIQYLPHADFSIEDTFSYTASDGQDTASATVTIEERGIAQWRPIPLRSATEEAAGRSGGEAGQMGQTLTISTADPNRLAVGIDTAAVYVSDDGGENWDIRRNGIQSNGVQSIAFDPVNPDILWAAGYRSVAGTVRAYPPPAEYVEPLSDGIYRSDDFGLSWSRVFPAVFLRGQAQNEYFAFGAAPLNAISSQQIYAATHNAGLLRSDNGGDSWKEVGPRGAIFNAIKRQPIDGALWLAADEGLWLSNNEAQSWNFITTPALPVSGIALHPTDPTRVWIALGPNGLWSSSNSGENWTQATGLPNNKDWRRVVISPADPLVMYADATKAGGPFPQYSHDGGVTWNGYTEREPSFFGNLHYYAEGLIAHPTKRLVAYDFGPLRRTTDGGKTWSIIGNGVSGARRGHGLRSSIAFRPDDADTMVFFHTDHGAARTTDGGDTWSYIAAPRQSDLGAKTQPGGAYDPTPQSQTLVSAVGGWRQQRLCRSENNGESWTVFTNLVDSYKFFAWHAQDPSVVYVGTATGGLRSDNRGLNWKPLTRSLRAVFRSNNDIIFAVTKVSDGKSQVERSNNRGASWTNVGSVISCTVKDIDVAPNNAERLYAACQNTNGGLRVYDGNNWSARDETNGLERDFFERLVYETITVDPLRPNVIYAGQRDWSGPGRGISRSTDSGDTWRTINWNLPIDLAIWGIVVSPHDSTVWVATDYGNWKMTPGDIQDP